MAPACTKTFSNVNSSPLVSSTLSLFGGDGDGGNNILDNLFGGGNKQDDSVVLELSASDLKPGPLRFLLNIYLVGEQNKPAPNSWLTRQGQDDNLQIYYSDGSGMLSLDFDQPNKLRAVRYGEKPSLQYQLQESVLLHGILDELELVAFGSDDEEEEIDASKRLIQFANDKAIEEVRAKLPARQAT